MARESIYLVGIFCDGCGRQEPGDVVATSQAAAEDGLRVRLVAEKGWRCDAAGDWCPRCRPAAAEAATGEGEPVLPSTEVPAPLPVGPPEVEALRAIDRIIGNEDTISAEELGKVRGIVLDTLNAWHDRQRRAAEQDADQRAAAEARARFGRPDEGLWA